MSKIRTNLRETASPKHVPAKIIEAPDITYAFSGKKVEIPVWNIIDEKAIGHV